MATRAVRKRAGADTKEPAPVQKKSRRGRKPVVNTETEPVPPQEEAKPTTARAKRKIPSQKGTKVTLVEDDGSGCTENGEAPVPVKTKTLGVKRATGKPNTVQPAEKTELSRADAAVQCMPESTPEERRLNNKIWEILRKGELKEQAIMRGEDVTLDGEDEAELDALDNIDDSEDVADEREHNRQQNVMSHHDETALPTYAQKEIDKAQEDMNGEDALDMTKGI